MIPGTLDLTLYRGVKFGPVTIQCLDKPLDQGGVPVPLTGYSAEAQVRSAAGKPLVLDLAPTIPTPSNGKIVIEKSEPQTNAITAHGDYVWDLVLINPAGERLGPFLAGSFSIKTATTRPS